MFQAASVQLFRFFSLPVVFAVMTARQTNNSLAAALSSFDAPSAPVSSTTTSGTSSFVSLQSSESVVVSSPLVSAVASANPLPTASTAVFSPDLVSLINQAVQASQRQPGPAIAGPASCPGASLSSASLGGLASTFFAAGMGFQPSLSSLSTSGRLTPLVVPTFVSTFNAPVSAIVSSSGQALSGVSAQLPPSIEPLPIVNSLADQPFVVGPGYSPKLVSQIRGGKFIDSLDLLAASLVSSETKPQLMLDGRLVLSAPPKKPRRRIEDITTWTEAFTVYSLVLTSFFPHRWKDLTLYKLLILRNFSPV